jgi:hypothetical protein
MLKLDYLLLCEDVIVDNASRISALKIFDNITVTSFPAAHFNFNLLFRLTPTAISEVNGKSIHITVRVLDPDNAELLRAESDSPIISLQNPQNGLVSSVNLNQTIFNKVSLHIVELQVDGKVVGKKEFEVIFHEQLSLKLFYYDKPRYRLHKRRRYANSNRAKYTHNIKCFSRPTKHRCVNCR